MKPVISLNGVDSSGKSTQLKLLAFMEPGKFQLLPSLRHYNPILHRDNAIEKFVYWFEESLFDEFIQAIITALNNRVDNYRGLDNQNNRIILLDRGLTMYKAVRAVSKNPNKHFVPNWD